MGGSVSFVGLTWNIAFSWHFVNFPFSQNSAPS
jgi:hypothetical protein